MQQLYLVAACLRKHNPSDREVLLQHPNAKFIPVKITRTVEITAYGVKDA